MQEVQENWPILVSLGTIADLTVLHNKSNSFNRQSISLDLLNLKNIEVFIENNKKYDTCIFLVGLAHRKGEKSDYQEFNSINFKTFKNLLDTFVKYKKIPNKIIFASTISIYGEKLRTSKYTKVTFQILKLHMLLQN